MLVDCPWSVYVLYEENLYILSEITSRQVCRLANIKQQSHTRKGKKSAGIITKLRAERDTL